jgi:N-acetylglucosamine-6-phosphate deacetylase
MATDAQKIVPLDLHFHGAGGHGVAPDGDGNALDAALDALIVGTRWQEFGYRYIATLPAPAHPPQDVVEVVAGAAAAMHPLDPGLSGCEGLRVEGCFLNPARAGVWPRETFRTPDIGLLEELVAAGNGWLKIIDVAPELPGALGLIQRARELGVVVSIAHTDATWEEALRGIDAGATLATHTFNAMRPVHHRDPGVVAAVLTDPRVTCEVICDGQHLHEGALRLVAAAAGHERVAAISDASPFAATEPGTYSWHGLTIGWDGERMSDGHGNLAGAGTLLTAAPQLLESCGFTSEQAWASCTTVPRGVLGSVA